MAMLNHQIVINGLGHGNINGYSSLMVTSNMTLFTIDVTIDVTNVRIEQRLTHERSHHLWILWDEYHFGKGITDVSTKNLLFLYGFV